MDVQELMLAAEGGDAETMAALLSAGSAVNAATAGGETALMRAAAKGQLGVVRLLLDSGADADRRRQDHMTALTLAAFFGHAEVVRELVGRGADAAARDLRGLTALNWASSRGNVEVVRLLRELAPAADDAPERRRVVEGSLQPLEAPETFEPARRPPDGQQTSPQQLPHDPQTQAAPPTEPSNASETSLTSNASVFDAATRASVEQTGRGVERGRRYQRVEFMRGRARERERQRAKRPANEAAQLPAATPHASTTNDAATATGLAHTTQHDDAPTREAGAPLFGSYEARPQREPRKNPARLPRVAAAVAAAVLLLAGGALFYRYARRASSPTAARPVEVVQPPTNVQELQPAPSPQAEQVVEASQQPNGQFVDANGQVITDPNAAQSYTGGALAPFPSTLNTAPTDMTVVPAQRGAAVPTVPRAASATRDEPAVVEYADPAESAGEARREPARREERARPPAASDASPRRDAAAAQAQPQRAAEDDSLPTSMIAPKPSATPKKKVIQWP